MIFLGLDVSSRIVGYTLLRENNELIKAGYIDLSKKNDLIDKTEYLSNELLDICSGHKIDVIGIEDCLTKFTAGRSSIKTIGKLIAMNYLTRYICFVILNIKPIALNVRRARSLADCKIPKGENAKEVVLEKVKGWYTDIEWPMMKRDTTRMAKEAEDVADSVIIARALIQESKE
tara:strand:+ start:1594 stop:2118 length:525 start_codon:yes stop_codon:yes gene_type:complete